MRSLLSKFSILFFFGLIAMLLSSCALDAGSDPVVTPDTTIPSTLRVAVTVAEDQDASDRNMGKSVITVGFSTNEIAETNTVIFTHGESIICNGLTTTLGNATSYWFRVAIPYNSWYTCNYYYHLKGVSESATIFSIHAAQNPLLPVLVRPVGNNPNFKISYYPGPDISNASNCTIQVTANAPNGIVMGGPTPQNGTFQRSIYTGDADVRGLNGSGNVLMTRTCTPVKFNNDNDADDTGSAFDAVNVAYTSTASYEVSWYPSNSPDQGTNS